MITQKPRPAFQSLELDPIDARLEARAAEKGIPTLVNPIPELALVPAPAVVRAPTQMHGKTSGIEHKSQGVFKNVPDQFTATRYHSLVVDRATLPDCLEVTAETDGLIMGLQHKTMNVHGVQFHPESIASEHGHLILKNFLEQAGAK